MLPLRTTVMKLRLRARARLGLCGCFFWRGWGGRGMRLLSQAALTYHISFSCHMSMPQIPVLRHDSMLDLRSSEAASMLK